VLRVGAVVLVLSILFAPMLFADEVPDPNEVNAFDRMFMYPYNESLSFVSDVTQYSAFLSPSLIALAAPPSDWFGIGLVYGVSGGLSFGTRTIMKMCLERDRPYMYDTGSLPPATSTLYQELIADQNDSFPSGHTIMAFTGAAFTHAVYSLRYPESKYRRGATFIGYAFATATALLRVGSGNHFVTDVLAGAAIGSLFGYMVPYLAWKVFPSWKDDKVTVAVGPTMVALHVQL